MCDHQLEIALATYNGSIYLNEFLESLSLQTYQNWLLLARDDGSIDESISIVEHWAFLGDNGIILKDIPGNIGVIRNFSEILSNTKAKYVMLADQDDVWYPDKIAKSLAAIQELERTGDGAIQPALVFSDLHVVDEALCVTHSSFIIMQGLVGLRRPNFRQLLTQNVAPGCTMIFNRALLDIALPIPYEAAMHDWWLIQVAALFGKIGYIDEPTMAYRQHGKNQVGASSRNLFSVFLDVINGGRQYSSRLQQAKSQAGALISRYALRMNKSDLASASTFANLSAYPPLIRQFKAWRHGLGKVGFMRNAAFYWLM